MARHSTKTTSLLVAWFGLLILVASAGTTSAESWLRKANEIDEDNFAYALWSDHGPPQRELQKKKLSFQLNGKRNPNIFSDGKKGIDSSVYTRTSPRGQGASNEDETWAGQVRAYHKYAKKSSKKCGKGKGKGKGGSSKAPSTGKGLSSKAPSSSKGSSDDECSEEPTAAPVTPNPATTPAPVTTPAPATTPAPVATPAPATTPAPASPTPAPASPTPAPASPTPAPATPALFPSSQPSSICEDYDRGPVFTPSVCNQPTIPSGLTGNGESCTEDDDCCSCCCNTNGVCNAGNDNGKNQNNCVDGSDECIKNDNACNTSKDSTGDCCSGFCEISSGNDGKCKVPTCTLNKDECDKGENCCSGNCVEKGSSGMFKCQA